MNGSSANPLHEALKRALKSAMARRDFLALLLESEVFVIGEREDGKIRLAFGERDGRRLIPFFSAAAELQSHVQRTLGTLTMTGRTLMEMTRGANLVADIRSDCALEITAEEIDKLLASGPTHKTVLK